MRGAENGLHVGRIDRPDWIEISMGGLGVEYEFAPNSRKAAARKNGKVLSRAQRAVVSLFPAAAFRQPISAQFPLI